MSKNAQVLCQTITVTWHALKKLQQTSRLRNLSQEIKRCQTITVTWHLQRSFYLPRSQEVSVKQERYLIQAGLQNGRTLYCLHPRFPEEACKTARSKLETRNLLTKWLYIDILARKETKRHPNASLKTKPRTLHAQQNK